MFSPNILNTYKEKKEIIANTKKIISFLASEIGERTINKYDNLVRSADFIKSYFSEFGHEPREESYTVNSKKVYNIKKSKQRH